jgi:hypothetical protein
MIDACVCCAQPLAVGTQERYCSVHCAALQLAAIRTLLYSTPQRALSMPEWHDLGADLASDLERLAQSTPHAA